MNKVLVLDAGHGGSDSGATGTGRLEKNLTLQITRMLRDELKNINGLTVHMTRDSDRYISLYNRAKFSNDKRANAFVSIHINSASSSSANGYETFHYPDSTQGRAFARTVHPKVAKYFRADRGVKSANFGVLRMTNAPAILLELGFIKNATDMDILETNMESIVKDIADGILEYMGIERKEDNLTQKEESNQEMEEMENKKDDITGHWAEKRIRAFMEADVLRGFEDGTFRPDEPITRAQWVVAMGRTLDNWDKLVEENKKVGK